MNVYGSLASPVGPGDDIDFWPNSPPNQREVLLRFELKVEHELAVNFSEGSPKVSMAPIGGWQQWSEHDRKPARLQAELPFTLTSSTDFIVKLRCNGTPSAEGHCPISDRANPDTAGTATVKLDITMPGISATLEATPATNPRWYSAPACLMLGYAPTATSPTATRVCDLAARRDSAAYGVSSVPGPVGRAGIALPVSLLANAPQHVPRRRCSHRERSRPAPKRRSLPGKAVNCLARLVLRCSRKGRARAVTALPFQLFLSTH